MQLFETTQPQGATAHQCQFGGLDLWASYLDTWEPLEPLGFRSCVVYVVQSGVVRCGGVGLMKGMHFSQSKSALPLNLFKHLG